MTSRVYVALCLLAASPAAADTCPQPMYRGIKTGAILRFVGATGAMVEKERGTIESKSPRQVFRFSTTHSNGFSREYLTLDPFTKGDAVTSPVLRKRTDFVDDEGPAAFLLTPDLPVNYYYATNQEGQDALHAIQLDDTWKRVGCGTSPRNPL